jgi:transcriptional regulator of NAD metabolism
MDANQRREKIHQFLLQAKQPVSATALAGQFGVSRQVVVGDVALLRASGVNILATPRGYIISTEPEGLIRHVACQHTAQEMEAELKAFVDNGCTVLDVVVEHPVYGQLTGSLQLSNRYEVRQFIQRCNAADAPPLSRLTDGIHIHTVRCQSQEAFERALAELRVLGILLEET